MFKLFFPQQDLTVEFWQSTQEKAPLLAPSLTDQIPFLGSDLVAHRAFLVALKQGEVVGVVSLVKDSFRIPGALGVGFISTHLRHQNAGVARALVKSLFELAASRKQAIANTSYEPDGDRWLRHVMTRTAALYPDVEFYERDQMPSLA